MILGVVLYAPYSHHFESSPACTQDVVTIFLYHSDLYHPWNHIHVPLYPALIEVVVEFDHPEALQQLSDLLAARVLVFAHVSAEIP